MTEELEEIARESMVEPKEKPPQFVTAGVMYQAVIFVSLAVSLLSCFLYDHFLAMKIAVFDLPGYLVRLKADMASGKMTEAQMKQSLDEADRLVNSVPSNIVVISGDVLLGQAKRVQKLSVGPR